MDVPRRDSEACLLEQRRDAAFADIDAEIRAHMDQARCAHCKSLPLAANAGITKLQTEKATNAYNVKYFEQGRAKLQAMNAVKPRVSS